MNIAVTPWGILSVSRSFEYVWMMSSDHSAHANSYSVVATLYFFFSSGQPSNVLLILGTLSFIWLFKSYVCKLIAGEKTSESLWWQRTDWRWSSCTAGLTVWVQRHHFQVLMTFIRPNSIEIFFSLLLLVQILIYTEEFKPRGMNQLPGTFVPRQKMRNLLWKVKRSHWSGRVPLSTPHLVNAIVAEYHVVFFFFCWAVTGWKWDGFARPAWADDWCRYPSSCCSACLHTMLIFSPPTIYLPLHRAPFHT